MAPSIRTLLAVWLCCSRVAFAAAPTCPLTLVFQYEYYCGTRGWVQEPANLAKASKNKSLKACARACRANAQCKSFKSVKDTGACQLYSKYLTDMATDIHNYQPGMLYDGDCFTTDCNLIAACAATRNKCEQAQSISTGFIINYQQYACAYGLTAQIDSFPFQDTILPASIKSACDAIQTCAAADSYQTQNPGTIDVHYNIPNARWICRGFEDKISHPYSPMGLYYPINEDAGHNRYTLQNNSVGAGYGLYIAYHEGNG